MAAKTLGTLLACVGAFVLIGGVVLLATSREIDDLSACSIAAAWFIIVAGAANIVSGLILCRQVWRKGKPDADR